MLPTSVSLTARPRASATTSLSAGGFSSTEDGIMKKTTSLLFLTALLATPALLAQPANTCDVSSLAKASETCTIGQLEGRFHDVAPASAAAAEATAKVTSANRATTSADTFASR